MELPRSVSIVILIVDGKLYSLIIYAMAINLKEDMGFREYFINRSFFIFSDVKFTISNLKRGLVSMRLLFMTLIKMKSISNIHFINLKNYWNLENILLDFFYSILTIAMEELIRKEKF